jgi:hypothetical protein
MPIMPSARSRTIVEAAAEIGAPIAAGFAAVWLGLALFIWLTGACSEAPFFIVAGLLAGFVGGYGLGWWSRGRAR